MSDILRVSFSATTNEDAKRAVENFAVHLRRVLEHYQNLWEHYVQLNEKYDELKLSTIHLNKEQCSGKLLDSNMVCKETITKTSAEPTDQCLKRKNEEEASAIHQDEESDSIHEHMLSASMSDLESDVECSMTEQSKALAKELHTEMLTKSPIISKGRKRFKRSRNAVRKNHLFEKVGNRTPEKKICQNEILRTSTQLNKNSNQSSGLGLTTSSNIDTSLLNSGKKLKQAKLMVLSPQKRTNVLENPGCQSVLDGRCGETIFAEPQKSSLITESPKTSKDSLRGQSLSAVHKPEIDDIIESSPRVDHYHSGFKSRLMLKQRIQSYRQQHVQVPDLKKEKIYSSTLDVPSTAKLCRPLVENNAYNNDNKESLPLKQKFPVVSDNSTIRNVSEGYGTMSCERCEENTDVPPLPILVHLDNNCSDPQANLPVRKSTTKNTVVLKPNTTKQNQIDLPITCSATLDETFFEPEEVRLKNARENKSSVIEKRRNTSMEQITSPTKKIQSHQSEHKSPKFVYKTGPVRNKAERAKLSGWSCWECKEYYGDLGLSEKELNIRKKQCSRHRAQFNEWRSTPEGFWNPVFPDTVSSSNCYD